MTRPTVPVLVVDDVPSFRRVAAQVVAATDGFVVAGEADCGEHALEFLENDLVGLVLMDVHMPGMGGVAAASEISRRFPTVSVVLLSVGQELELPDRARAVDAQFCAKARFGPAELEELWQAGNRSQH